MSTGLIILICVVLLGIVVIQIGKVSELAAKIRGEKEVEQISNDRQGLLMMPFVIAFLVFCVVSAIYYRNYMLGYGPHDSASVHGESLDSIFNTTLFFTGIVFVLTQILLFWFAYKYRQQPDRKARFISHDNKLEIVWTIIPAVVMTFLVVGGLDAWNEVMADVPEDAVVGVDYTEIEAMGYQFAWSLRYPGPDGKIGTRDFRLTTATNPIGQDWTDEKNWDDFHPNEIVLPVGKPVRVRILARDVLHNFDLPHFRVKMDAVPGMPTYFVFTPRFTTEEYRQKLREVPEYQVPSDSDNPESDPLWKTFEFELACAELCGKGHYSMRRLVKIVSEDEYEDWFSKQQSYYMGNIRNTDADPNIGRLLDVEIRERRREFNDNFQKALSATDAADKIVRFKYVNFETGGANLTPLSKYELDDLVSAMKKESNLKIELAGHTDNTGDADANQTLSESRATAVYNYLIGEGVDATRLTAKGYGINDPIGDNSTAEGREMNRRTEFRILSNDNS